jgi:murein DD-endopeptidase MepM/ murein hydrolase activator NlpD
MKYSLIILLIPILISCTAIQNYDDGTNGSLSINADILSDDGTTAFVNSFYKNEAPLITKNLKEENKSKISKTGKITSDNLEIKSSSNSQFNKINTKDTKPEIEVVSIKDKSKNKVSTSKNNIENTVSINPSKDKTVKNSEQTTIKKDTPLFFYPVSDISIKKDFSLSGADKNTGIDFLVGSNSNIFATAPGVVIFAGEKNSLGKSVFVYHDKGYISIYYNLSSISVVKGSSIASSDTVVGKASSSFHFEIRHQTSSGIEVLNPKNILQKRRN